MIQFFSVAGSSTELPNEEPTTHDTSGIDILIIVIHSWDTPVGLSEICPIPQNDHQLHWDKDGDDPQGDIHDGLARERGRASEGRNPA